MNSPDEKLAVLMENGLWEHLEAFSAQALTANPNSSIALAAKGFALLRRDNSDAARQLFLDALRTDPSDRLPKYGLHFCYYRTGNFAQAERCLVDLLKEDPESETAHGLEMLSIREV